MKILMIYFSQTGYTRKVAECIRDGALTSGVTCDLVPMADADTGTLREYDLVGIGSPVFYYQEPLNVQQFLEDLPPQEGARWFVFCTHGCMIGITLEAMAARLQRKGAQIVGYHDTYADATAPFIPHPTLTTGHPDAIDYEKARLFGSELAARTRRLSAGEACQVPKPKPLGEKWRLRGQLFSRFVMENYLPRLEIDLLKCTLCRTCEKNCPVGGIDVGPYPPRIQDPCIYCWRCVMVCPEVAIDARHSDWGLLYNSLPEHYRQFRPLLEEAATRGDFRWQTDPDAMAFENTQLVQRRRRKREMG